MANYVGIHCPVCQKRFIEEDDIVVCPICGAPYHRECYQKAGHCTMENLHACGKAWEPPAQKTKEEQEAQKEAWREQKGIPCPMCGANNPPEGIFCQICGSRLRGASEQTSAPRHSSFSGQDGPAGTADGFPFGGAVPRAYSMAFGGLSPEEEIDGISARDIALYVGENSYYYLPRFKAISNHTGITWNWSAMFLNFIYFFYRKMYDIGILLLILLIAAQIPSLFIAPEYAKFLLENIQDISIGIMPVFNPQTNLWAYRIAPFIQYGMILISFLLGMNGNRLYMKHVFSRIRKIKMEFDSAAVFDDRAYTEALAKKGRVSRKAVIFVLIGCFLAYFGSYIAIVLSVYSTMA